ncbi:MAG: DMT family transporter [Halolamina sp.]
MTGLRERAVGERVPPLAALAVAVVAVSTSAILVRLSAAPNSVKALYRVVFTVSLLAPWALGRYRSAFGALSRRDLGLATVAGLALAVHFASWFASVELTSIAASVTLVQSQPLFVAVGAWVLLEERLSRRMVAGIAVAVVGMVAMSFGDPLAAAVAGDAGLAASLLTGEAALGNALAVVGAVAAAGYVLAGRSIRQRVALVPYVVVVYAACAVGLFGVVLAEGAALTGYPPREWLLFLSMAVGPGVFGHTVVNWALAHVESSVVSVSLLGEPVGSTLLALVVLSEVPTATTAVGGAVVLAGIYLTASDRRESA